jgi:hypothetical protein
MAERESERRSFMFSKFMSFVSTKKEVIAVQEVKTNTTIVC